jgi:hypothetical protein
VAPRLRLVISIEFILFLGFPRLIFHFFFTDDDDWKNEDNGGKLEKNEVISLVKQRTKSIVEALENYREL